MRFKISHPRHLEVRRFHAHCVAPMQVLTEDSKFEQRISRDPLWHSYEVSHLGRHVAAETIGTSSKTPCRKLDVSLASVHCTYFHSVDLFGLALEQTLKKHTYASDYFPNLDVISGTFHNAKKGK